MLEESKYLIESANKLLGEIKGNYLFYIRKPEVPYELKDKIKEFLAKINSSLDYQAFIVFSRHCEQHIPPEKIENKRSRVYFPCRDSQNAFDNYIKDRFPKLNEEAKDIVELFNEVQSFKDSSQWLKNLNTLNNSNKHRSMSKQTRNTRTHINFAKVGGVTISNFTSINSAEAPIMVNRTPVDFINPSPYDGNFDGSTTVHYVFDDIKQPVINTLEYIYTGALEFTNKLEKLL